MPNHVTNIVKISGDRLQIQEMREKIKNDDLGLGTVDFNKIIPMPRNIGNNLCVWCIANWGTKWNAYAYDNERFKSDSNVICFHTAWAAPHPVLQKLSEMYPNIRFEHEWADEDIGVNCGRYIYEVKTELTDTVKSLKTAYPDAIAWLYIPGTAINYPVMQSDDNDYYLHHAFDGSSLKAGSIFLDHRCENRFMNNLNILYGHNMKNGSMFAGVTYFKDKSYFDSHRYGWLITEDAVNRVDFFALCVTDWHDEIYNGFQQLSERMPHIKEISRIYEDQKAILKKFADDNGFRNTKFYLDA